MGRLPNQARAANANATAPSLCPRPCHAPPNPPSLALALAPVPSPPACPQAYCSTVPVAPLLPAYWNLAQFVNITSFAGATANGSSAGSGNASSSSGGSGGGGGLTVSSPYCLISLRGGSAVQNGATQCVGTHCSFAEGSASFRCGQP